MIKFNTLIEVKDDGLCIPEVRQWSEEKYRLIGAYGNIFTTSMRNKWNNLVYLDLFAGAGYSKIKETGKIYRSSPLIALSLPYKFTHYIFCEENPKKIDSLRKRVARDFPDKNVTFIEGDINEKIEILKSKIPIPSKGNTVLSFSFIDPYSLNLKFSTIQSLGSSFAMDFLILLATGMDANRNLKYYLKEGNLKVDNFIGNENWRNEFSGNRFDFIPYLSKAYDKGMTALG